MQPNIVHAQIVIPQGKRIFQHVIQTDGNPLGFMLSRKAEKILDNAMGALRLLVEFFAVLQALRPHLSAGSEQLAVAENRGERIV